MAGWMITIAPSAEVRLQKIAEETGRSIENLMAAAVEDEALGYFRGRNDDPAMAHRKVFKQRGD